MDYCVAYIRRDDKYLFIHRNVSKDDIHYGKYLGIGGHIENGESPMEAVIREVREETGLGIRPRYLGKIEYLTVDKNGKENLDNMYVFISKEIEGTLNEYCDEGTLEWLTKDEFLSRPHWSGDEKFLVEVFNEKPFETMRFVYGKDGDKLAEFLNKNEY